jgi:serpin B
MTDTRRLAYAASGGWTAVTLPAGEGVVLDVLVPDGELAAAERELTPAALDGLLAAARPTEVQLELPRFRVTGEASLRESLAALGVRRLFEPDADLSGITDGAIRIWVDDVVHKCVLTVDEDGLEGAAATAVLSVTLAAMTPPPRPVPVHVDRPFLVLVRHRVSGALYFLARVTDPR